MVHFSLQIEFLECFVVKFVCDVFCDAGIVAGMLFMCLVILLFFSVTESIINSNSTTTIDELGAAWDLPGLPTSLPMLETSSGATGMKHFGRRGGSSRWQAEEALVRMDLPLSLPTPTSA